jgi:hypothetical protein
VDAYIQAFPLLNKLWTQLRYDHPIVADYMQIDHASSLSDPKSMVQDNEALQAIINTVPAGQCRAVRTTIGSYSVLWSLRFMRDQWLGKKTVLLVGSSLSRYQDLFGFLEPCWDPLNQWVQHALEGPPRLSNLSLQERIFCFLKKAGVSDLMTAQQTLLARHAEILLKKKQGHSKTAQAAWMDKRSVYLRKWQALNRRLDQLHSALFEWRLEEETVFWKRWRKMKSSKKPLSQTQKSLLPFGLKAEKVEAFLKDSIATVRAKKRALQRERLLCKNFYRALHEEGVGCFYDMELFFAQWHLLEAQHLLKQETTAMRPACFVLEPQTLWDPNACYRLVNIEWVLVEHAQRYSVLQGAMWSLFAKKALFLGDDQPCTQRAMQESQCDFQLLLRKGLVQNENDFEELEWEAIACSRSNSWQRVWAKQKVSLALENRVRRDKSLVAFIKDLIPEKERMLYKTVSESRAYAGLRFIPYPGQMQRREEQWLNRPQARCLMRILEHMRLQSLYQDARIAIVTPFEMQRRYLSALYKKQRSLTIQPHFLDPAALEGELYDWIIVSMVLTKDAVRPLYYDQHLALWRNICLSARYGVWIIGDGALFDVRLQSPTGKLAHVLRRLELKNV